MKQEETREDAALIIDQVNRSSQESATTPEVPNNLGKVIYIGVIMLVYTSTSNSGFSMVSQIFEQIGYNSLGRINLFLVYIMSAISNTFAPTLVRKASYRVVLYITSWGYVVFLLCGSLGCFCEDNKDLGICSQSVIYAVNIFGAIFSGLFAAVLWIAENSYISALSTESTKGLYFGVAWALVQSSQILGNIFAVVLLNKWSHLVYFSIMTAICFVSALGFIFVPQPKKKAVLLPEEVEEEEFSKRPLKEKLINLWECTKEERLRPLLYYMVSSGFILAFLNGFLYDIVQKALPSNERKETINEKTSLVFIALGVLEFFGGLFVSKIADRMRKINVCKITNIIFQIALFLSLIADNALNYTFCFFIGALWGFADCSSQAMNTTILGADFKGKIEYFAIFNQFQCIGAFFGLILTIALEGLPNYWYILILLGIQIVTFYQLNVYDHKYAPDRKALEAEGSKKQI